MILDFPLKLPLLRELKDEYMKEAKNKGNSWRTMPIGTLFVKLQEEYDEVQECINNGSVYSNAMLEELKDLILVACMIYEVLQK
jgi:NTP pyrophosphatase (non-canonical NTP hydrolase)